MDELKQPDTWRVGAAELAELIANMLFVFNGAGTVVVVGGALTASHLLVIALAHGLA